MRTQRGSCAVEEILMMVKQHTVARAVARAFLDTRIAPSSFTNQSCTLRQTITRRNRIAEPQRNTTHPAIASLPPLSATSPRPTARAHTHTVLTVSHPAALCMLANFNRNSVHYCDDSASVPLTAHTHALCVMRGSRSNFESVQRVRAAAEVTA